MERGIMKYTFCPVCASHVDLAEEAHCTTCGQYFPDKMEGLSYTELGPDTAEEWKERALQAAARHMEELARRAARQSWH